MVPLMRLQTLPLKAPKSLLHTSIACNLVRILNLYLDPSVRAINLFKYNMLKAKVELQVN